MQPEARVLEQVRGLSVDLKRIVAKCIKIESLIHDYRITNDYE